MEHMIEIRDGKPAELKAHMFAILDRQTKDYQSHGASVLSDGLYRASQIAKSENLGMPMGDRMTVAQLQVIKTVT